MQYASLALAAAFGKGANKDRLKLIGRDIRSLEDHVTFLLEQDHSSCSTRRSA